MKDLHNVIAARTYTQNDGTERTVWTQIGIAFPSRDGQGFDLQLFYVPVPQQEGMIRILVRPPMPADDGQRRGNRGGGRPGNFSRKQRGGQDAPMGSPPDPDPSNGEMDDIPY